ncbi:MAG: hypothetical protein WD552_00220 [Candidatus Paceibacterota bacterium]
MLILFLAATLLPWWISLALVAVYAVVFRFFFEGVLVGWLIDSSFAIGIFPWVSIAILLYIIIVEGVVYFISH